MNVRRNSCRFVILLLIIFVLNACQGSGLGIDRTPTKQIGATASETAEPADVRSSPSGTSPQITSTAPPVPSIAISGVQVQEHSYIHIRGQSDLPEGACILTQLEQEGEKVSWWPDGACATVKNSQWQLTVQLGENGAPQDLDESAQYAIRAWYKDDRTIAAQHFPFDLQGPPAASTEISATVTPESLFPANLGKLAYVQAGDIWVKTLPDGEVVRLTTDGQNQEPRWSASGEWLAYRKGEDQVHITQADGSQGHALEPGEITGFAWHPRQDILAYIAAGEIWKVDTRTPEPVRLIGKSGPVQMSAATGQATKLAWQPSGGWISFEWWEGGLGQPDYQGIWAVSIHGDRWAPLYESKLPQEGEAILAGWTAGDGYLLIWKGYISASLLADGAPLFAIPVKAGDEAVQLIDSMLTYQDYVVPHPSDPDQIAFISGAGRATWENKTLSLGIISFGEKVDLSSPDLAISSPAWSQDREQVAFAALNVPEESQRSMLSGQLAQEALMKRKIWIIDVGEETQELRQLTHDANYRDENPLWSKDGSQLLFARLDAQDRASLWLLPIEGGEPQQVVETLTPSPSSFGYYGHLQWDDLFDWWQK